MSDKRYTAKHRHARLTARKARLAVDMIRGLDVNKAMDVLQFSPKRSAAFVLKVLKSATANAAQDENVNVNNLYVSECRADVGSSKGRSRWRPGPQGRAMPYTRRTSHVTVIVAERGEQE